jgi:hypothetical protein
MQINSRDVTRRRKGRRCRTQTVMIYRPSDGGLMRPHFLRGDTTRRVPLKSRSVITFVTPVAETSPPRHSLSVSFSQEPFPLEIEDKEENEDETESMIPKTRPPLRPRYHDSRGNTLNKSTIDSRRSSFHEAKAKAYWALPRGIRKPL